MQDDRQEKVEGDRKVQEAVEEIRRDPGSPRDSGPPPEPAPEEGEITDEARKSPTVNDGAVPVKGGSEQLDQDR